MRQDLRFAWRTLFKSPAFTIVAVLALALGIGANTAMFTIVRGVILKPLPYADSDRLILLQETFLPSGWGTASAPNFKDWRERNHSFEGLLGYQVNNRNLQGVDQPEQLRGVSVTANAFSLLRAEPMMGRTFAPDEDTPGKPDVVVLSAQLWKRRFASNPNIVGQTITLDNVPHTVIGIMPASFDFPPRQLPSELWTPLKFTADQLAARGSHWMFVAGRLKPGVSIDSARSDMVLIAKQIEKENPDTQLGRSVRMMPLQEAIVGWIQPTLLVLLGAVGVVLLISCTNVANLLLARAAARSREVAVRTALGAGRGKLIRLFLAESLTLAMLGSAVGLMFAVWGVQLVNLVAGRALPRPRDIEFDPVVFAFLLGVAVGTAILFGLVPAWHAIRSDIQTSLRDAGAKGATGGASGRLRNSLVVAQIALAFVLLMSGGSLMRLFLQLQNTNSGMQAHNVLTFQVSPATAKYPKNDGWVRFYVPVLEKLRAIPGVRSAGAISFLPLQNWGWNGTFGILGRPPSRPGEAPTAEYRGVTPGYFKALGIPIVAGRDVSASDTPDSRSVLWINAALAKRYFPNENPIGQRIGDTKDSSEIVGVVGDVRQVGLGQQPLPELYVPISQAPQFLAGIPMSVVVSADVEPTALVSAAREAVRSVDPSQPIFGIKTMERVVADSLQNQRMNFVLMTVFAALALVLASAGVYGVMSYLVTQRVREFGVRIALGAQARDVVELVLREAFTMGGIGLVIGLAGCFAASRLLTKYFAGVKTVDPVVYGAVAVLLLGVMVAATLAPARRAVRVDPIDALRQE